MKQKYLMLLPFVYLLAPLFGQQFVPNNMVRIAGGTFLMGSPSSEVRRHSGEVQRKVTVNGFYMGKYPVTQQEYQSVMGTNPSDFKGDNLPVERVSWFDAIEYCNRLSQREGLTPAYTINGTNVIWNRNANGYRLPTEAEWEYACRAGTTTRFNTGDDITSLQANFNDNEGGTTPVGTYAPNAWGLHDMHGNIDEWCWDWYASYDMNEVNNPVGASSGSTRVVRGGGWYGSAARNLRSASRGGNDPDIRVNDQGFRLVRS